MKRPFRRPVSRMSALGTVLVALLGCLGLVGGLGGCSERSPIQSVEPYDPTDGLIVNLGSLAVRNLLVVSAGSGQPGVVSGALVNTGTSDLSVSFTAQGDSGTSAPVSVPAGQLVRLGSGNGATSVQFATVSVAPGGLLAVRVSTPPTGPRVLEVPVLSPSREYATITPTPQPTTAPTDTPTGTPSDTPTDTPTDTGTSS
ncbi:MAG: hypothetical protein ACJ71T_09635 [Actinomycetales bacterium]